MVRCITGSHLNQNKLFVTGLLRTSIDGLKRLQFIVLCCTVIRISESIHRAEQLLPPPIAILLAVINSNICLRLIFIIAKELIAFLTEFYPLA